MSDKNYFLSDPARYTESFTKYAAAYGALMRIVYTELFAYRYQDVKGKEVYDVVGDFLYSVNGYYEKVNNIKTENDYNPVTSYINKNELKTMLSEVVQEYFANVSLKDE
jgi:hypothetical protein